MDRLFFNSSVDNIFDFYFMDDFTTVVLAEEEDGIDTLNLKYEDGNDFYSFSEKKCYTAKELFKKFNIEVV